MKSRWPCVLLFFFLSLVWSVRGYSQSQEVQQLLLDVEKLGQLKEILSDLKKSYQILSSGYEAVKNISVRNFNLHQAFLDGLLQVSPIVRSYYKIKNITEVQLKLFRLGKKALGQWQGSGQFSPSELDYNTKVLSNLYVGTEHNVDALLNVLTAGKMRMTDDERLANIDQILDDLENKWDFLNHFKSQNDVLMVQRLREQKQIDFLRQTYGITK